MLRAVRLMAQRMLAFYLKMIRILVKSKVTA
jgi:hypothetical protein